MTDDDDQPTIPVPHAPAPAKTWKPEQSELGPDESHKAAAKIWLGRVRDTLRGQKEANQ